MNVQSWRSSDILTLFSFMELVLDHQIFALYWNFVIEGLYGSVFMIKRSKLHGSLEFELLWTLRKEFTTFIP